MLKQKITDIYCVFLIFMYVFTFNIIGFIDSSIISLLLLIPPFFLLPSMRQSFFDIVFSKSFRNLTITYVLFIIWIFIAVTINGKSDYSFVSTLIHLYLALAIGALLFSYMVAKKRAEAVMNWLTSAFVIQSVIIVSAIVFTPIRSLILKTKPAEVVVRVQHYGYRGLSLSSSSFFGLSIAFGLILLLFFEKENSFSKKNTLIRFLSFVFLFIGASSAGRTSLIGLVFGIILFIIQRINDNGLRNSRSLSKNRLAAVFFSFIFVVLVLLGVFYYIKKYSPDNILRILQKFSNYLLEFFSDSSGGVFHTTSSDYLLSNMFFLVSFPTFLKGDGLYSAGSGYYMGTDSGIMRPILYCGFLGLVFLFFIQKEILNFCDLKKQDKSLYWLILFLVFVFQIKGEVLGFAILFNSCLFLFVLSYGYVDRSKKLKGND